MKNILCFFYFFLIMCSTASSNQVNPELAVILSKIKSLETKSSQMERNFQEKIENGLKEQRVIQGQLGQLEKENTSNLKIETAIVKCGDSFSIISRSGPWIETKGSASGDATSKECVLQINGFSGIPTCTASSGTPRGNLQLGVKVESQWLKIGCYSNGLNCKVFESSVICAGVK